MVERCTHLPVHGIVVTNTIDNPVEGGKHMILEPLRISDRKRCLAGLKGNKAFGCPRKQIL